MSDTSKREDMRVIDLHDGAAFLAVHGEDGRVLLAIHQDGTVTGAVEDASEAGARFVSYLRAHLFEQAHTPTDDEREAARRLLKDVNPQYRPASTSLLADDIRLVAEAALRRTAVQEPQGEPTDAQVDAGCVAFHEHATGLTSWGGLTSWARLVEYDKVLANRYRDGMRRALRAAYETKGEGR